MEDAQQQAELLYRQIKDATKESVAAALDSQPKWLLVETFGQALWNGDSEAALRLLKAGVDATASDLGGQPLVHLAADAGDARVIRELVRRGARIDVICEGESVLQSAAGSGDVNTVNAVLDLHNWDADAVCSALLSAQHVDVVETFLSRGANPNHPHPEDGSSPLCFCVVTRAPIDQIKALLERGADPGFQTRDGETPLSLAVQEGLPEVVEVLMEAGANIGNSSREELKAQAAAVRQGLADLHAAAGQLGEQLSFALPSSRFFLKSEPRGDGYRRLLDFVAQHCDSFRLVLGHPQMKRNETAIETEDRLKPFLIAEEYATSSPGTRRPDDAEPLRLGRYRLDLDSLKILQVADRLYAWCLPNLPEDLACYTPEGREFLGSIAHEREAWIDAPGVSEDELDGLLGDER